MKAMAATVLEEEQGRFDSGLLCKRSAWKDHQDKLCLDTMYKGELSGEMASIPSHACSNLVELYGMCGQDSDASKTTSASVADTMRRALAGIYHAAQQRPTFAAIDAGPLETTFEWWSLCVRRMDDFFIHKTLLESIKEDLLKREDEGMLEEDSHMICMYACICSVGVRDSPATNNEPKLSTLAFCFKIRTECALSIDNSKNIRNTGVKLECLTGKNAQPSDCDQRF